MAEEGSALEDILVGVAARLRSDFEVTKILRHRGGQGSARESALAAALEPWLPGHIQIAGSAEVISVEGQRSGQCDLVIFDRRTQPLLDMRGHRLIPAECVYIVIEVKSRLTRSELMKACDQLARVKALPKIAKDAADPTRYLVTRGMVFAFDGPMITNTLSGLADWAGRHPVTEAPDEVFVLGRGFTEWRPGLDPAWLSANLERRPSLHAYVPDRSDVALALITRLSAYLVKAQMPALNLDLYADQALVGQRAARRDDLWQDAEYRSALESSWHAHQ